MNNGTLNDGHLIICHPGHGHDLIIQNDFSVHDDLRKKFEDMNLLMVSVIIIRMVGLSGWVLAPIPGTRAFANLVLKFAN